MSPEKQLDAWLEAVADELGCSTAGIDSADLLDVARDVAHNQIRPGAPTSTFYVGYALGLWESTLTHEGTPPTPQQKSVKLHELSIQVQKLALNT